MKKRTRTETSQTRKLKRKKTDIVEESNENGNFQNILIWNRGNDGRDTRNSLPLFEKIKKNLTQTTVSIHSGLLLRLLHRVPSLYPFVLSPSHISFFPTFSVHVGYFHIEIYMRSHKGRAKGRIEIRGRGVKATIRVRRRSKKGVNPGRNFKSLSFITEKASLFSCSKPISYQRLINSD